MKLRRIRAVARKEMLQIWRDPLSLLIALLMPLMQMLLLGYGVNLDTQHLPVCVYDQEGSQTSQALLKHFQASRYFDIVADLHTYRDVTAAVDGGRCRMAIVVPHDFSLRLADTHHSAVQAILDATDDNTASIAIGYAEAVIAEYAQGAELQPLSLAASGRGAFQGVGAAFRVWFNEDLTSRNFIIPGIVALIMALVGAQLTSLTISREWERGTMELLISTPITPAELMIGKLTPYFVIGMLDAAFCLVFSVFWFDVPFRGSLTTLFATTALFLIVVLGIGYLISCAIRSQVGAAQMGLLVTLLPTSLLSGYTFPIDQMPPVVQGVTYLVFARYYVTILKSVFLKGSTLQELAGPVLALVVYAAVIFILAARAFRKRLG